MLNPQGADTLWSSDEAGQTATTQRPGMEPLLKWPGGKRRLLQHLMKLVPETYNRYFEGFAGGAALFFALTPDASILADKNGELINCYSQIRDQPYGVIERLSEMRNTERDYYLIRATVPDDPIERAARFIYLVTLSFNGIYRENLRGVFNVPYGYKLHLEPCDPSKILAASSTLAGAKLRHVDFELALKDATAGDLIYLDPPYTVAHASNGFVKYNAKIFSWDDQVRLARVAKELDQRGCHLIISNAAHSSIAALYEGFQKVEFARPSVIAASSEFRKSVKECIFHNGR